MKRKKYNENYFEQIDNENKAYWLGFIYADGYVRKKLHKEYMVISPDGEEILVKNLRRFCDENNIVFSTMSNLSRGIGKTSKGWKCKQFNNI